MRAIIQFLQLHWPEVQVPLWHADGPLPEADELRRIAIYGGVGVKE